MAYRIAERVMAQYDRHEKDCTERWERQAAAWDRHSSAMEALRTTALANFTAATADRAEFRETLEELKNKAAGLVLKFGAWVIVALVTGLSGAIWYIITSH
jgi:hypothetical protein